MLGTSLLWRSTVAFIYLKVKSAKYLCLLPVVLVFVLLFWSWSWSCKQRSWSCYFGLGLKNLVLFTSLGTVHEWDGHADRRTQALRLVQRLRIASRVKNHHVSPASLTELTRSQSVFQGAAPNTISGQSDNTVITFRKGRPNIEFHARNLLEIRPHYHEDIQEGYPPQTDRASAFMSQKNYGWPG